MTLLNTPVVDLLAVDHEPTDEQLAEVMHDVLRVRLEKRSMSSVRMRDMMEAEGCRVYLAQGGREALGLFEVHKFDGIFTDVGMPGMSGWELAQAIRQRDEKVPIAVITGWGSAVGSDEQREAGVNWVITKPFRAERITELAQEIIQLKDAASQRASLTIVAA